VIVVTHQVTRKETQNGIFLECTIGLEDIRYFEALIAILQLHFGNLQVKDCRSVIELLGDCQGMCQRSKQKWHMTVILDVYMY